MRAMLVPIAALAVAVVPTCADAARISLPNSTFPDGSDGFAFRTSGGILNPGVLVGFNPQPDPPGIPTELDLGNPTLALFSQSRGNSFVVTVSLFPGTPSLLLPAVQAPNADGRTQVSFCDGSVRTGLCDGSVFVLSLAFSGLGGIVDWAAFNPQPDPPGDWLSYQVTFKGDATFALAITENGAPLTFSAVPEPGTWLLMGLGFAALGAFAWRTRARAV
jgi:prepilin-type processing-associated H-X9-DG protein